MYCLLCAESKSQNLLKNLQDDEELCLKIVNRLLRFNVVLIFHNVLPKTVCTLCIKRLEQAFTFVSAVEKAQAILGDFTLIDASQYQCDSNIGKVIYDPPLILNNINYDVDIKAENISDNKNSIEVLNEACEKIEETEEKYSENEIRPEEFSYTADECNKVAENDAINKVEDHESFSGSDIEHIEKSATNSVILKYDIIVDKENIDRNMVGLKNDNIFDKENEDKNIKMKKSNNIGLEDDNTFGKENIDRNIDKKYTKTKKRIKPPAKLPENVDESEYINKQIKRLGVIPIQYISTTWENVLWRCSHCDTLFPNIDEHRDHAMKFHKTCHAHRCNNCNMRTINLDKYVKHLKTHTRLLHYSCYKCFMKFQSMGAVNRHVSKCHKNSDYICKGCNTTFDSKEELNKHTNKYYKNVQNQLIIETCSNGGYICKFCDKFYENKQTFKEHVKLHEIKREFVCDICGKDFYSKRYLKQHMTIHVNTRSYKCEICRKAFRDFRALKLHLTTHSGLKPYTCDICGKSYRLKTYLANHMGIHMNTLEYQCSGCDKKFRTKPLLKIHMRQHTGAKPFSCEVCSQEFTHWSNCSKHMRRKHGLELAKTKRSKQGPLAVDPTTREVLYPDEEEFQAWKEKMKEHVYHQVRERKRRPKHQG